MSEIKGYVHQPSYYFEADDQAHRAALDELLMVQGWRRYSWEKMAGLAPFDLKYYPEQGIEVHGRVVSRVRGKPRTGVMVSSFLARRGMEDDEGNGAMFDIFPVDSLGRFSFISDTLTGKWDMILSVGEKGKQKRKSHRILLDRLFRPKPRAYALAELQLAEQGKQEVTYTSVQDSIAEAEELERFFAAMDDSTGTSMTKRVHRLDEVKVEAEGSKEDDIFQARSKALAYYDVASEVDEIRDRGDEIGNDVNQLLCNVNPMFRLIRGGEYLSYKSGMPLIIVNYRPLYEFKWVYYDYYKTLNMSTIKSIYLSEDLSAICDYYREPSLSCSEKQDIFSCVVFIETYPEGEIPVDGGSGVRKTWLDGYSIVDEFYSPDYSVLPEEPDYRRTLYWNPSVTTDEEGRAQVRFYNNSCCHTPRISVETVTADGQIGVYDSKE